MRLKHMYRKHLYRSLSKKLKNKKQKIKEIKKETKKKIDEETKREFEEKSEIVQEQIMQVIAQIKTIEKELETSNLGLNEEVVIKRINKYGKNILPQKKKKSISKSLIRQ